MAFKGSQCLKECFRLFKVIFSEIDQEAPNNHNNSENFNLTEEMESFEIRIYCQNLNTCYLYKPIPALLQSNIILPNMCLLLCWMHID